MSQVFDCTDSTQLLPAARAARQSVGRGELVVMPTDTVYGVAADAFSPEAVQRLLDAKGRGRQSPPPVLIPNNDTLAALAAEVVEPVRMLAAAFWPGPLTIVVKAQSALSWDLGDTAGTVALRIPSHELALELLRETGPLAVSSANTSGAPAARDAEDAQRMLGDSIAVYLDAGPVEGEGTASTIVDATALTDEGGSLRILREGAVTRDALEALFADEPVEQDSTDAEVTGTDATGTDTSDAVSPDAESADARHRPRVTIEA